MHSTVSRHITFVFLLTALAAANSNGGEPTVDFGRDIQPILSENCYFCHGPDANERQADLRLDSESEAKLVIEPGDAESSELFARVTSTDPDLIMPPPDSNRKLSPEQIKQLEKWIADGAKWGQHWAYAPIVKADVPNNNAIDHFIQHGLAANNLSFSPSAKKTTLIRRVALDLTGLPPTLEEIDRFVSDTTEDAYTQMVERYLVDPAFGERMAWNWLDTARYADTNGYQGDNERTMWPWRDWVVNAFNRNMPFDQFSIWQLAGDLLSEPTDEQILATGFLRNHPINGEGGRIAEENRVDYVMDMAETTGTVWLGLTFNCCRCHDHKYDQLTQVDYYSLFAFFNQTPVNGGGGNGQTPPVLQVPSEEQRGRIVTLDKEVADAQAKVDTRRAAILRESDTDASDKAAVKKVTEADDEYKRLAEELKKRQNQRNDINRYIPKVMVMQDRDKPRKTYRLNRGSYQEKLEEVSMQLPAAFGALPADAKPNRLALARWLFDESNTLTPRVVTNRLWAQFFGIGLVKTTEDFGVQGERPSHPELLDWLAAEYRDSGWNTKHMIRLILNSQTYRQSSRTNKKLQELDPENRLLARSPRYRMPFWMIRDHALTASGILVNQIGGAPVNTYQPAGVWEEASFGKKKFTLGKGDELYRRSIYTFWRRIAAPTMLFDNADRMVCSVKSYRTNTPLQALNTLNDITFVEAARRLATELLKQHKENDVRLEHAFRRITSRRPTASESRMLLRTMERTLDQFKKDTAAATALVNVGESKAATVASPEELASWTTLCLAIQNLDEALTRP